MTIREALKIIQGRDAGPVNRSSVLFAETLLFPEEEVLAAVIANVASPKEHFPGIVVLTDQRILAACGLPGIKRSIVIPVNELVRCEEAPSFLNYKVTFWAETICFSLTVNPEAGERLSIHIARLNGEEDVEDETEEPLESGLFNPALLRISRRRRRIRDQERSRRRLERERTDAKLSAASISSKKESAQETALRLERQLEQARVKGTLSDTDPQAVAARLAAELAAAEGNAPASEQKQ